MKKKKINLNCPMAMLEQKSDRSFQQPEFCFQQNKACNSYPERKKAIGGWVKRNPTVFKMQFDQFMAAGCSTCCSPVPFLRFLIYKVGLNASAENPTTRYSQLLCPGGNTMHWKYIGALLFCLTSAQFVLSITSSKILQVIPNVESHLA